jgi:Putative zinc-finger
MAVQNNPLSTPCKTFEEDLVLLHYGDLGGSEREALQSHMKGCAGCAGYLKELGKLLPLTVKADEPGQTFWDDYSRELRHKLAAAADKKPWWQSLTDVFQPRSLSAAAGAAVVVIALAFTLGRGLWPTKDVPHDDAAMMEALPVAENLEFFKAMDVLDDLDLLEFMGSQGGAA